ncbi:hypothetical protein DIPPA_08046 [Diplonema papillatum]|nr:hypothetical protein DIPPA_08046 [Diplonema papillatum]
MAFSSNNFQQPWMDGGNQATIPGLVGNQGAMGGDGGGFPSPSQGGGSSGDRVATSIMPITCRQFQKVDKLSGDMFKIGGRTVYQVSLFVQLNGWQLQPGGRDVQLSVSDGTATVNVTIFGNFQDELKEWANTAPSARKNFLRLYGHIRTWNNATCLLAFHANFEDNQTAVAQMLHHANSCVHAVLYAKHGPLDELQLDAQQQQQTAAPHQSTQPTNQPAWGGQPVAQGGQMNMYATMQHQTARY